MKKLTRAEKAWALAMQAPFGPARDKLMADARKFSAPRKKRERPEEELQIAIVKYLRQALPKDCIFFHPANGGFRSATEAVRLKAMGVTPGIPDLIFIYRGLVYGAEIKAGNGSLTESQETMKIRWLAASETGYSIVRSLDEMKHCLMYWGIISIEHGFL